VDYVTEPQGCSVVNKNKDGSFAQYDPKFRSFRSTINNNMRGGLDSVEPLGSYNSSIVQNVLNLYSNQKITNCLNTRVSPDCIFMPNNSDLTCKSLFINSQKQPTIYDSILGYCLLDKPISLNKLPAQKYYIGNFPKAVFDSCKTILPKDRQFECSMTSESEFAGTRIVSQLISENTLKLILNDPKKSCVKGTIPVPNLSSIYKKACFESIKNSSGTPEKNVYLAPTNSTINQCIEKNISKQCYIGKVSLNDFYNLLKNPIDKETMIKSGIK
jgi:hypothetical protein